MRVFLLVALFVSAALAAPNYVPVQLDYHEAIGIPKAARIKAAEEASDFDGARIVGGAAARLGQFPFMGGLIIDLPNGQMSTCGSSLLTNTRLVTAAHCWLVGRYQPARQLTLVLGSVFLFSGGTRVTTNQVVPHPNYSISTVANDIAVIFIPRVSFNNNIRPINLPTGSNTYVGQVARAAGFGLTSDGGSITPGQYLSFVDLVVISNEQCRSVFGPSIISSTLCTLGAPGENICSSDSGGPLQIGNTLIGVTSFGSSRCEGNHPGAFARATYYVPWIRQYL